MTAALAVLASGVGALARYGMAGAVQRRTGGTRPWGTAAVNVAGAVLFGLSTGLHASGRLGAEVFTIVGPGLLGGFTTFSTWMVESVRLGGQGTPRELVAIAANVFGMLAAGLVAAAVGMRLS